ncbi:MAG: hypothetical protein AAF682_06355 [Planctomycetota bacterium]
MRALPPLALALLAAAWTVGCPGVPREAEVEAARAAAASPEMSFAEYAAVCTMLIDEIPPLDSRLGAVIPITVDGEVPPFFEPLMDCDRPSLLPDLPCGGQCVPYSRLQLLRDDAEAQMVALFRRTVLRPEDDPLFDEIDLIVHSVISGDTCWFRATADNPSCDPAIGLDGHNVPVPQAPGADAFWNPLDEVVKLECGNCHDNDPFYYSPYVAQVIHHLPANPLGKYSNAIGPFAAWPPLESLTTRGNTCTGCHRIGVHHTSGAGLREATGMTVAPQEDGWARSYPASHWMPAHNFLTEQQWEVVYRRDAQLLLDYNEKGECDGCVVTPIPGGGVR